MAGHNDPARKRAVANTRPDPDPPLAPEASAHQSTQKPSGDRLKKISGGPPTTSSKTADPLSGIPHPINPYKD